MKHIIFLFFLIALTIVHSDTEDESQARLLVTKHILNSYLVENMDIVVKYSVYNIGNSAAVDATLTDRSFVSEAFQVMGGQLNAFIGRIPPHFNYTHVVVVRPVRFGYFNFTSAEVTYKVSAENPDVRTSWTSEPGEGAIIAFRDYNKRFSSHTFDWAGFAVMTLPSLLIPVCLWYSSKSKYENFVKSVRRNQ